MTDLLAALLLLFVLLGLVPTLASFVQFLIVGLHGFLNDYPKCGDYTPNVAFIVPAWNEADVLGTSIDSLMALSYPQGGWRIYVVDDASTDRTPAVLGEKIAQYPGAVFHLRRAVGGQGKAHTLNHGLRTVLAEDWAEAIMSIDADVLFEPLTLRRMTRHLADPEVGAVTAYIKEGSSPGNLITRHIAFEYITAQAAARRAQNVIGSLACLAGGAQLHSRANLEALGGAIDTSSFAEDTHTTLETQLGGRRVVFDGNALVWAEEPDSLTALWKQRLRWARGNLQLTAAFRDLWFRPARHRKLGGFVFGTLWFSVVLAPVFMLLAALGMIGLYVLQPGWLWAGFGTFWALSVIVYMFETLFSFVIDPATGRRAWLEGIVFPGLVSLGIMMSFFLPGEPALLGLFREHPAGGSWQAIAAFLLLGWSGLSTLLAWGVYRLDKAGAPRWLSNTLLVVVGYGPLMSAIALAAFAAQAMKADLRWDKTMKSGKARILK
jgi:cellulose synthase/poly-beta-1,6-N-acetylglucosamine synthase-like glycosyltransferase